MELPELWIKARVSVLVGRPDWIYRSGITEVFFFFLLQDLDHQRRRLEDVTKCPRAELKPDARTHARGTQQTQHAGGLDVSHPFMFPHTIPTLHLFFKPHFPPLSSGFLIPSSPLPGGLWARWSRGFDPRSLGGRGLISSPDATRQAPLDLRALLRNPLAFPPTTPSLLPPVLLPKARFSRAPPESPSNQDSLRFLSFAFDLCSSAPTRNQLRTKTQR